MDLGACGFEIGDWFRGEIEGLLNCLESILRLLLKMLSGSGDLLRLGEPVDTWGRLEAVPCSVGGL